MLGLILKDIFTLKRQARMLGFVLIIYGAIAYLQKSMTMILPLIVMVAMSCSVTCLAYEERSKWWNYSNSLPVSKTIQVLEKYLLPLVLVILSIIVFVPLYIGVTVLAHMELEWMELLYSFLSVGAIGVVYIGINIPIAYKFGVEKTRIAMFIPLAVVVLAVLLVQALSKKSGEIALYLENIGKVVNDNLLLIVIGGVIGAVLFYGISFAISLAIVKNKEN